MSPFYLPVPPLSFQDFRSSLLSLLWILFQVNCLFPLRLFGLVDFHRVPSSAACFSVFSFCLICCLGFPFFRLEDGRSSYLWNLPPVGGIGLLKISWLGNLCLCCGGRSRSRLWRAVPCPVLCFVVSMRLLWLGASCLLMGRVVFLFCWRLSVRCPALELVAFRWDLVLVLRWRPLGDILLINVPWGWEFSAGPKSWTQVSHQDFSGHTAQETKTQD